MDNTGNPKIIIVTTPIRPTPTYYPPVGSLAVVTALKGAGFANTHFYNIDLLRPSYEDVLAHLKREKPDILGISAIVSTAYAYTKKLSLDVKRISPETTVLLGGNLGASAEIILRKTGVDFVCTGEGEETAVEFARGWKEAKSKKDYESIKGLAFLDESEGLVVTPYAEVLKADAIYDIDWSILEGQGQMDHFVRREDSQFLQQTLYYDPDPRVYEPHRKGKTTVYLYSSKGCVARCTFCHRWTPGIRYVPIPILMERIDAFVQNHNAGFIQFCDENFGSDKKWLAEFLREMKQRDLLWHVSGMRVSTISQDLIEEMKHAGCVVINFGMETGSQKMLKVMDKVTTVEQNKNAVKWMAESGMYTIVQLVIGMPGETPDTIKETIEFTSYFSEQNPDINPNAISINFAQALPGTPLYETARRMGKIGQALDDEEQYLLKISDRDARDGETYINLTDYPQLEQERWHIEIQVATRHAYVKKWGLKKYYRTIMRDEADASRSQSNNGGAEQDSGLFADPARMMEALRSGRQACAESDKGSGRQSPQALPEVPGIWQLLRDRQLEFAPLYYPEFFWSIRHMSVLLALVNSFRKYGVRHSVRQTWEYLAWKVPGWFSSAKIQTLPEYLSLRKVVKKDMLKGIEIDNPAMSPLRKGR